jgi:hypothetical protein
VVAAEPIRDIAVIRMRRLITVRAIAIRWILMYSSLEAS